MYTLLYKNVWKHVQNNQKDKLWQTQCAWANVQRTHSCDLLSNTFWHFWISNFISVTSPSESVGWKSIFFCEWRLCASLAPTRQCWAISAKFRRRCFFGFLLPIGFCLKSMSHPNLHTRNLIQIWSVCKSAIWKSRKHFLNASSINDKAHIFRLRCWYVMAYASPSRHIIPKKSDVWIM